MSFFFPSRGKAECLFFAICLTICAIACLATKGAFGSDLDVAAIAGRPAPVITDVPRLDVAAIAAQTCQCPDCDLTIPHKCGEAGCVCGSSCRCLSQQEPLDLVAMSPKRRARTVKPDETAATSESTSQPGTTPGTASSSASAGSPSSPATVGDRTTSPATMAAAPRYVLQRICNGRFCQYQWVLAQ